MDDESKRRRSLASPRQEDQVDPIAKQTEMGHRWPQPECVKERERQTLVFSARGHQDHADRGTAGQVGEKRGRIVPYITRQKS